ncbi:hypothetical protein BVX99_00905 [bacterium F16]|nr:hypothetical protein BVX99_00905 [bacterium F16]
MPSLHIDRDLDHLKTLAKELLTAHRAGDRELAQYLQQEYIPFQDLSIEDICSKRLTLTDAQRYLAFKRGYRSWAALREATQFTYRFSSCVLQFDPYLGVFLKGVGDTLETDKDRDRSVKDLIESFGVPHTEVDSIRINGESVGFSAQISPGDEIVVKGRSEPIDLAHPPMERSVMDEPRFVADVHLGKLVRYLRMLGFDCYYQEPWDDDILAQVAAQQRRIMLSRDVGLLKRKCVEHGIFLRSDRPAEQAKQILRELNASRFVKTSTRCTACNGMMRNVDKSTVLEDVPEATAKIYDEFYRCQDCLKVYWKGAHFARLGQILSDIQEP